MNGPTRAPNEEITYDEGITPRQGVIMLGLATLILTAFIIMVPLG